MRRFLLCLLFSLVVWTLSGALAWAAAPVIEDVNVCRGRDTDAPDWAKYHQSVWARVSDGDGVGDIVSVTITIPAGADLVKTPDCGCWWQEDDYTIACGWCEWDLLTAPAGGSYTIVVTDAGANTDTLVTAAAPEVSEVHPAPLSPPMETVIYDTVPTFEWNAGLPGSGDALRINEEGTWDEIWSADVSGQTQVVYDFDGNATQAELQPNRSYFWEIESWYPDDYRVSDPRVEIWTSQSTRARFTVYGDWPELPPELPGKFAYECVSGYWAHETVMGYNTDPTLRTWLAPDGSHGPDWSPDGTKLVFGKLWDGRLFIDYLDGSPPVEIPGIPRGGDPRWAPDGNRVVYHAWDMNGIWIANVDGSDAHPLVENPPGIVIWGPQWSPDGQWIVYTHPDPENPAWRDPFSARLIRPDGTEDHPVMATGVDGYEEYGLAGYAVASWSPDAKKLVLPFTLLKPGADPEIWPDSYITGIGTISLEGGPITPVFTMPAVPCCGNPFQPLWSADGTKIIFISGHHIPDPRVDEPEPRVELWVMNADGSGEPIRLTYNNSFEEDLSWWAPNTEPGSDVSVTKGDTTVSFDQVDGSGSTTVCVTDDPPGETPEGFQFLGDYYDIATTAETSGVITIEIHYDDADVPGGQEEWLSLLHWEVDHWVDITVRPIDTVNNIITGQCTSLSGFGIAHGPQLVYPLPPINADGSSIFKLNRTVPVKFQLIATDGSFVDNAVAYLYVEEFSDQVTGTVEEPGTSKEADTGYLFRYDPDASQYIYNLGTKNLDIGTWTLMVVANDLPPKPVQISLR